MMPRLYTPLLKFSSIFPSSRGVILTRMLLSIEKHLGGVRTAECFDWIAGTSTGGIMALALASGMSVMECQVLYMKMKDKVFSSRLPHFMATGSTTRNLRSLLHDQLCECRTEVEAASTPEATSTSLSSWLFNRLWPILGPVFRPLLGPILGNF